MLGSNRNDVFAVGLAGLLAVAAATTLYLSASQQQSEYSRSANHYAHQYADERAIEAKECIALAPPKRDECQDQAREAARSGQRSEYDLEAQRVTATWTQHMGIAAMIGMAVSIVGVGLVWTTFRETRNSADAARANLEAFLKGQRAHIEIEPRFVGDAAGKWYAHFKPINHGLSVAEIVKVEWLECDDALYPAALHNDADLQVIVPERGESTFTIGISDVEPNDLFFIAGRVTYQTLTLTGLHSHFCFKIDSAPSYGNQVVSMQNALCMNLPKDT